MRARGLAAPKVERRSEARYEYDGLACYRRLCTPGISEEEAALSRARVVDVSRHGMLMAADEPLLTGQRLEVFAGPDRSTRRISGVVEVVRCTKRVLMRESYNTHFNPGRFNRQDWKRWHHYCFALAYYDIGLRSAGSKLFDHIGEIVHA